MHFLKRSDMATHSFTCKQAIPALTQPQIITALWLVGLLILPSHREPTEGRGLSRPGWLVTYRNKVPPPGVEPGHGHAP